MGWLALAPLNVQRCVIAASGQAHRYRLQVQRIPWPGQVVIEAGSGSLKPGRISEVRVVLHAIVLLAITRLFRPASHFAGRSKWLWAREIITLLHS